MLVYSCDNPRCNESVAVDDEEVKSWLVVSYMDDEDESEWHYCCWDCLLKDAEDIVEANGTCSDLIENIRMFFSKKVEEKEEENESNGDSEKD